MQNPNQQQPVWFYRSPSGEEFGPYSDSELQLYTAQGRIVSQGFIRHESSTEWTPAFTVVQAQQVAPPLGGPPTSVGQISGGLSSPTSRSAYILLGVLPSILIAIFGVNNLAAGYTGRGITQLLLSIFGIYGLTCLGVALPPFFCISIPLGIGLFIWMIVEVCTVQVDAQGRPMR